MTILIVLSIVTLLLFLICLIISICLFIDDDGFGFLFAFLAFMLFVGFTNLHYNCGYSQGQIDAINGKNYMHLRSNPDGTKNWEMLETTTQPSKE